MPWFPYPFHRNTTRFLQRLQSLFSFPRETSSLAEVLASNYIYNEPGAFSGSHQRLQHRPQGGLQNHCEGGRAFGYTGQRQVSQVRGDRQCEHE